MKEIISAVIFVATLFAGTQALQFFHNEVRKAALEKAEKGLPSLTDMIQTLKQKKERSRARD